MRKAQDFNDDPSYSPDSDSDNRSSDNHSDDSDTVNTHRAPVAVATPIPGGSPSPLLPHTSTDDYQNIVRGDPVGKQQNVPFTGNSGMDFTIAGILALAEPIDYFKLFFTPEIINIMVEETNLYATQVLENATDIPASSRLHNWTPTDSKEMR